MTSSTLKSAYCKILSGMDPAYLGRPENRPGGIHGLSGLFLPSIADGYYQARHKVMIVGAETRGWEPLDGNEFESADYYVDKAWEKHSNFFASQLKKHNGQGNGFHNFTRSISKIVGSEGLIYSNIFCFAWGRNGKKGSPIKSGEKTFSAIKEISKKILDAQIEILQPDYIIFANGITSAPYRREFFPHGDAGRATNPITHDGIRAHYFWEYTLDRKIKCFRIHHPSAQSRKAAEGRNFALDLLKKVAGSSAN